MTFHRLNTNPAGYDSYPSGYDFINTPASNDPPDPGSPALVDGKKGSGPNQGTYFVGFGEDGISMAVNRGLRALAENTDELDNQVRRPVALLTYATGTVAGVPQSTIVLPATPLVYLGSGGGATQEVLDSLFQIVDSNNNEIILQGSGLRVYVSSVTGGTIGVGGGFADGQITLHLSQSIPVGISFKVIFGVKGNLGTMHLDGLLGYNPRAVVKATAEVENLFRVMRAPVSFSEPWNSIPFPSTLWDLASSGLNERYLRATVNPIGILPEDYYPDQDSLDTAGSGAWYERTGPAMTAYANRLTSNADRYLDPIDGLWVAKARDKGTGTAAGGASGFVFYGTRHTSGSAAESDYYAAYASFLHLDAVGSASASIAPMLTHVHDNAPINIQTVTGKAYVTLTGAGMYFAVDIGEGSSKVASAVAPGFDMLEIVWDDGSGEAKPHMYIVVGITGLQQVEVRELNGRPPVFPGTALALATGLRHWHRMAFGVGDGSVAYFDMFNPSSYPGGMYLDGLVYSQLPYTTYNSGTGEVGYYDQAAHNGVRRGPARFFGPHNDYESSALEWGGYNYAFVVGGGQPGYYAGGSLRSDGSVFGFLFDAGRLTEHWGVRVSLSADSAAIDYDKCRNSGTDGLYNASVMHYQLTARWNPVFTVTMSNCLFGSKYVIAIERIPTDSMVSIAFVGTTRTGGAITMMIAPSDALLSQADPLENVIDVYTGVHMAGTAGGRIMWTVARYTTS